MTALAAAEQAHVDAFARERSDWMVCVLEERMSDEEQASREHKYARAHPYLTGMHFVLRRLQAMGATRVLDIGSPIAQNVAVACLPGIDLTVLDVRQHDDAEAMGLRWVHGTATSIPFTAGAWPVITSLWVMGHVGDGRYGDDLCVDGDRTMLAEVARVLAPGGTAIIGPGLISDECGNIFNLHRIYTWAWLRAEFERVGLEVIEQHELFVSGEVFLDSIDATRLKIWRRDGLYGLAVVRKKP